MTTDTSEKGLEALIVADMTGRTDASPGGGFSEEPGPFVGLHNWLLGDPKAYDRAWTIDLAQLRAFVAVTQPPLVAALDLGNDSPARRNSWPGCKARSPSAASSTFCGMGSNTVRTRSSSSTERRRPATSRPLPALR